MPITATGESVDFVGVDVSLGGDTTDMVRECLRRRVLEDLRYGDLLAELGFEQELEAHGIQAVCAQPEYFVIRTYTTASENPSPKRCDLGRQIGGVDASGARFLLGGNWESSNLIFLPTRPSRECLRWSASYLALR